MTTTDTFILGDFNAHHSSWYSSSTDSRSTMLESMVSGSNFGILNWDSPTRLPDNANPSSPDVSLASADVRHYQPDKTSFQHQPNKANWDRYSREIEDKMSKRRLLTNSQKVEKILRAIILKAASHHIPSGRHRLNTEPVKTDILEKIRARDDLRSRNSPSPVLQETNDDITRITNKHKR